MARGEWVCRHGNGERGCVNMARGRMFVDIARRTGV